MDVKTATKVRFQEPGANNECKTAQETELNADNKESQKQSESDTTGTDGTQDPPLIIDSKPENNESIEKESGENQGSPGNQQSKTKPSQITP